MILNVTLFGDDKALLKRRIKEMLSSLTEEQIKKYKEVARRSGTKRALILWNIFIKLNWMLWQLKL